MIRPAASCTQLNTLPGILPDDNQTQKSGIVELGEYCFIGAGAVVTKNVKPYALMVDNPARKIGWMSQFGERLNLPLFGSGEDICKHTGRKYKAENGECWLVEDA